MNNYGRRSINNKVLNNKKIIVIIVIVIAILVCAIMFINKKIEDKINNIDVSGSAHGVIINKGIMYYKKAKESRWKKIRELNYGEFVYIIEEIADKKDNLWYKIKAGNKVGYVKKENVGTFEFSEETGKVLMSDVSKFNIMYKHFNNSEEYAVFILKSKINYVYIRAGGRGYGEEGNFYTDPNFQKFIDTCEFLGVPYGFYYIDEAVTSEEIDEEVEFMKKFIDKNSTSMCVLPLALDVENHDGVGRADNLWEERAELLTELISKFEEKNIETIVYSNAIWANMYLSEIDTKFWIAYYNLEKNVPNYWYTNTEQEPAQNLEFMNKVVGWQFTENGVGEEIPYKVDISLVDNSFFKSFVK